MFILILLAAAGGDPLPLGALGRLGSAPWWHGNAYRGGVAYDRTNTRLATVGGYPAEVMIRQLPSGRILARHRVPIAVDTFWPALSFADDGTLFLLESSRFMTLRPGAADLEYGELAEPGRCAAVAPDGSLVAAFVSADYEDENRYVALIDVPTRREVRRLGPFSFDDAAVRFSADGLRVSIVDRERVRTFDARTSRLVEDGPERRLPEDVHLFARRRAPGGGVYALSWDDDRPRLKFLAPGAKEWTPARPRPGLGFFPVAAVSDGRVIAFDAATALPIPRRGEADTVLAMSRVGRSGVAVRFASGAYGRYDALAGKRLLFPMPLPPDGPVVPRTETALVSLGDDPIPDARPRESPTAVAPDGTVAAARRSAIRLTRAPSVRFVERLATEGNVTALLFSADGRVLYSAQEDGTVLAWSTTGISLHPFESPLSAIRRAAASLLPPADRVVARLGAAPLDGVTAFALAYDASRRLVAALDFDGVRLHDERTGAVLYHREYKAISPKTGRVFLIGGEVVAAHNDRWERLARDGTVLAGGALPGGGAASFAAAGGEAAFFDGSHVVRVGTATGREFGRTPVGGSSKVGPMTYSPGGRYLVAVAGTDAVAIDARTGRHLGTTPVGDGADAKYPIFIDARTAVVRTGTRVVALDVPTMTRRDDLRATVPEYTAHLAWDARTASLLSFLEHGRVTRHDLAAGTSRPLPGSRTPIGRVFASDAGFTLAGDAACVSLSHATGEPTDLALALRRPLSSPRLLPDGRVEFSTHEGRATASPAASGPLFHSGDAVPTEAVRRYASRDYVPDDESRSPDGRRVVRRKSGTANLLGAGGNVVASFRVSVGGGETLPTDFVWSADSARLAAVTTLPPRVEVYAAATGLRTHVFTEPRTNPRPADVGLSPWLAVAFSPEGAIVAVANESGDLVLHDLAGRSPPRHFDLGTAPVWSPDSRYIAATRWGRFAVMDARTGVVVLRGVGREPLFLPGGRVLTCEARGTATVWRVPEAK